MGSGSNGLPNGIVSQPSRMGRRMTLLARSMLKLDPSHDPARYG
jgi:hypothetical protein